MSVEDKEKTPPVVKYDQIITEFSWWQSRSGERRFVVVRLNYDIVEQDGQQVPVPMAVQLLQVFTLVPFVVEWNVFIDRFNAGELVKIIINQ